MTTPCEQADTIKKMDNRMGNMEKGQVLLQQDLREAFAEIKESIKRQTDILIDLARSDEKIHTLFAKSEDNSREIQQIREDMKVCTQKVEDDIRSIRTQVCTPIGKKLDGTRSSDNKLDKNQIGIILGAAAGFLTFIYTLVNKMLDFILSGGTPS